MGNKITKLIIKMINAKQILRNILTKEEVRSLIFLEIVAGIIISYFSLILYQQITNNVLRSQTIFIDNSISNFVIFFRQPLLTPIMFFLSILGNEFIIFASIIVVIFLTLKKHHRETIIFAIILLMGVTLSTYLKLEYKIPRPFIFALTRETSYSYPSGHALNSLLFYGTISFLTFHFTRNKKLSAFATASSVILIFLIGLSRIYLGVHNPSDILGGYIVGLWLLATTILVDKTIIFFRLIRESSKSIQ